MQVNAVHDSVYSLCILPVHVKQVLKCGLVIVMTTPYHGALESTTSGPEMFKASTLLPWSL